jgi:ABC-type lipoprotein release transport system permease subunit
VFAVVYRVRHRLRTRWKSTLVLAGIVAITGGIVLTLAAGAARTLSAPDRYSEWRGDVYDASLEQHAGPPRTAEVAALAAVARVDMASFVFGGIKTTEGGDTPDVLIFAGTDAAFGTRLVGGREPDPAAPGEFVATRSWTKRAGATLGDRFTLVTISQEQADKSGFDVEEPGGPTVDATLVGVIDGPGELQDGYSLSVFPTTLLGVGDVGVATTVGAVSLAPAASLTDLRAQLDALPDGGAFGLDVAEWVPSSVGKAVSAQGQGLAILAGIVAIATIVVIGQLLSRQVRTGQNQSRILSALGMTRGQVVVDPVVGAAVPIVLGSVAAMALAYLASGLFPVGFVEHVEPHPGRLFDPLVHGVGAALFAVLLVAWVVVALRAADRVRGSRSPGVVDRLAPQLRSPEAATGLRFAFTRPAGGGSSPRAAVVGMVAVFGLLVGALTFGASLGGFIDDSGRWGANFDVAVGAGGGELPADAQAQVEADPNVTGLTLFGTILTSVGNDSFDVTGMQPVVGGVTPVLLTGRLPQGPDEIAIGQVAADRFGVAAGDELVVVGATGAHTFHVSGLAVMPSVEGGDGVGEGGLVMFAALQQLDPSAALTAAGIRLRDGAPPDAAQALSDRIGMGVGPLDRPGVILNIDRVRAIPYAVAATLALLAVLNLTHQLILSAGRRRRDVAVLRALGADRHWITTAVHWQATLFTAVVLALAAPVGIVAGVIVFRTFVGHMGALDTVTVPLLTLGLSLVAVLVLVNLVAAGNAWRARRHSPALDLAAE